MKKEIAKKRPQIQKWEKFCRDLGSRYLFPWTREFLADFGPSIALGIMTLVFFAGFLFWIWWAWSGRNKARWEADSRLPLNDGGES